MIPLLLPADTYPVRILYGASLLLFALSPYRAPAVATEEVKEKKCEKAKTILSMVLQ
jgi:hypothetical protein